MAKFHDIQQNTDEWLDLRCGKIGGSSIGKIMANYGKAFGKPAHDLAVKIAIEQITGKRQDQSYSNAHMERGHEQEPIARALYERENFCVVDNGGFFDDGVHGVSPDGLVDDDGVIEIKSVISSVHFANKKRGGFDPTYQWQYFLNLMVTGREWIDFVSFCADFPEGKRLYEFRIFAEDSHEEFVKINNRVADFLLLIQQKKEIIIR